MQKSTLEEATKRIGASWTKELEIWET